MRLEETPQGLEANKTPQTKKNKSYTSGGGTLVFNTKLQQISHSKVGEHIKTPGYCKTVFEEHTLYKNFEPGPDQYQSLQVRGCAITLSAGCEAIQT